jgi:RNA polymerase sigma-70 factor (ECF subfamily)
MDNHKLLNNKTEKWFLDSYKLHVDAIFRHCYFRVYDKDLAEDLVQETFIKTWKYISLGNEVKNIKPFLYKVATNLIIDNSRKKTTLALDVLKENKVSIRLDNKVEDSLIKSFEAKEILKVVDQLNEKYRQVILFRYVDDLSPGEISDILGESTNAVSVRLNYAIKKLREIINNRYKLS